MHLLRCAACAAWQHPPRLRCTACGSGDLQWVPSAGKGRIFTYTVVWRALHGAFSDVPFVVAVAELDEGVRLLARLEGVAPDEVRIGAPVTVTCRAVGDELALPLLVPRPTG